MERVWNGVWNAVVTKSENLLESEIKRQAPRHDPLRVPPEHCPTKLHRLNKPRRFSNLDDWEHETRVWVGDLHMHINTIKVIIIAIAVLKKYKHNHINAAVIIITLI